VAVAQLVRAPACGAGGRGFKSHQPPHLFPKPLLAAGFSKFKDLHSLDWYKGVVQNESHGIPLETP